MTTHQKNASGLAQKLTALHSLLQQFDDLVDAGARDKLQNHCSYSSEDIQNHITQLQEQERLLKVGIIGRVKAGKSSLINALLFDGRDVLPKAATPMTAALTTLTYSQSVRAEVEFFTAEEINGIKHKAEQFEKEVNALAEKSASNKKQRESSDGSPIQVDMQGLKKIAARRVASESPLLKSANEIYQRLKTSPIKVEELPPSQVLEADTTEGLRDKLSDFVGADGSYMPFTRTLHIGLPVNALHNLEVVDTPGLNDAIASREQRTYEMLKECNVVFVVSPSGQFLHEQDQELASRLSKREGIQEIYLVASRIDEQLHSSERERFGKLLPDVVTGVKEELTKQAHRTLTTINNPVLASIATKLDERLYVTAGIAQTLLKQPESTWDETAKHALSLLNNSYPDNFSDSGKTKESLELLAGRNSLLHVIASVHEQKEAIVEKQVSDFLSAQNTSLIEAKDALLEHFQQKRSRLEGTELIDTEQALNNIRSVKTSGASAANILFKDSVDELSIVISKDLKSIIRQFSKEIKDDVNSAEGSVSETYQREKDGFFSGAARLFGIGGYEDASKTVTIFQASEARSALEDMRLFIEHALNDKVQLELLCWRRKLSQGLTAKLRDTIDDKNVNSDQLSAVCRLAITKMRDLPNPDIPELPGELTKGGKLKGHEAEDYLDEASRYLSTLRRTANNYAQEVAEEIAKLSDFDIGDKLFSYLHEEAEQLQSLLHNKRLTLDKLSILTDKLQEIERD